jgi:hypothetical protein
MSPKYRDNPYKKGGGGGSVSSHRQQYYDGDGRSYDVGGDQFHHSGSHQHNGSQMMMVYPSSPSHAMMMNNGSTIKSSNHNNSNHITRGIGAGSGPIIDSDSFISDADKLSAILKCSDIEMHKHLLAVDYFRHRKNRLLIPTIFFSLSIAICGFVSSADILSDEETQSKVQDTSLKEFLTLLASSLGFLVMLLVILSNGLDYSSQIKFHVAAAEDLGQLSDKVRLYRIERAMDERAEEEEDLMYPDDDRTEQTDIDDEDEEDVEMQLNNYREEGRMIIPHSYGADAAAIVKARIRASKRTQRQHAKLTQNLVKQKVRQAREEQDLSRDAITFNGYHAELNQIARGCRSDVPPHITKFFDIMENRVELMSLSRLGVMEDCRARRNQILRMCAIEIYNEVSNSFFWPLWTPNVDRTVEAALKRVGQLLNLNYRARVRCKLIPCCPVPLCCKKKTTDNVFAIINEGIDQRELDMMQAERAALIRMEKEGRARRNAVPERVLEMRETFYSENVNNKSNSKQRDMSGALMRMPNGNYSTDHDNYSTTRSIDPDGHAGSRLPNNNTATGHSFRGEGGEGGGRTRSTYRTDVDGGGMYPQDREGFMIDYEDDLTEDEDDTYQFYDDDDADEDAEAKARKKEKKKRKKAKKKKKKAKKKQMKEEGEDEEEEGEEVNMEVEFQKDASGTEGYSLYSELEMSEQE